MVSAPTFRLNGGLRESVSATYVKLESLLSQLSPSVALCLRPPEHKNLQAAPVVETGACCTRRRTYSRLEARLAELQQGMDMQSDYKSPSHRASGGIAFAVKEAGHQDILACMVACGK